MSEPLTILYVDYTNGIGVGGGQRSLSVILDGLDREKFTPVVACPPDEELLGHIDSGIRVLPLPLPASLRSTSRWSGRLQWIQAISGAIAPVWRLRNVIELVRPSIVHANNLKTFLLSWAATAGRNIPLVWHVRDIFPPTPQVLRLIEFARRKAGAVIAVSAAVAEQFAESSNVSVVHNAVDLRSIGAWNPEEARASLGVPPGSVVVGYAGRLDPGKGIDTLVDSFALMAKKCPTAVLLIAGEGPEREALEKRIRRAALSGRASVLPFQRDMGRIWASIDIAVQPSVEQDSFPRSVIEAMAWGRPVVGSRIGGIAEAIVDGETGFLVRPGDVEGIAARLWLLLTEPEMCRRMGHAGRARAIAEFSADAQRDRLAQLYQSLLGSAGDGHSGSKAMRRHGQNALCGS